MGYSPDEKALRKAIREAQDRGMKYGWAVPVARARIMRSSLSLSQMNVRTGRQLRILAPGNGATADDIGKFWFVVGYSKVGGPDIVPNE